MRSRVQHTRVDFEPLNISCSIECTTPFSPLAQVSNTLLDEYEPDRTITPCVIRPYVMVKDKDGIFPEGNANARLSIDSIKWKFNGVDIKNIPEFAGKYEIITAENEFRGSIKIFRNIPVTESWIISFEAQFEDWRRPKIETVQSNELSMFTTDIGENMYKISVNNPSIIYNPVLDNLLLYDFMNANGLLHGGEIRDNYKDDRSFEKTVTILISTGETALTEIPSDLTLVLKYKDGDVIVPGSNANPEVISMNFPNIEFDLRLIEKEEYELILKRGERILSATSFSIRREEEKIYECMPARGSDISPHQEVYINHAIVNLKNQSLAYPEIYYKIVWFTEAQIYDSAAGEWKSAGEKRHNIGRVLDISVSDIGVGVTKNDNYFSVGFDVEPHGAMALAIDNDGYVLTDENGKRFII